MKSLLVNDSPENLQQIIDDIIDDQEEKNALSDDLSSLGIFLKYGYRHHVMIRNDDCTTHDLDYILGNQLRKNKDNSIDKHSITCTECKFPYYAIDKLKRKIVRHNNTLNSAQVNDALKVLDDALERFVIYMGHKARCTNQNESIKKIEDDMKKVCIESNRKNVKGLLVMDFKMKFNPLDARESTINHYGKRGISWHSFCIIYYLYDNETKNAI